MSRFRLSSSLWLVLAACSPLAQAGEVSITITNLTPGMSFAPLLVAAHDSATHLFTPGQPASAAVQKMAECANFADIAAALTTASKQENPAAGILGPGKTVTTTIMSSASNNRLSIVGMFVPSNDAFVGLQDWPIPTTPGTYIVSANAYDAGTEANDEIRMAAGASCAPGVPGLPVAAPLDAEVGHNGTGIPGVTAEGYVHIHRNTLGDFDNAAGVSDLQSNRHRWLNPVARVTVVVK